MSERKPVDNDKLKALRDKLPAMRAASDFANKVTELTGRPVQRPQAPPPARSGAAVPPQVRRRNQPQPASDVRQVSVEEYLADKKRELERQIRDIDAKLNQTTQVVSADKPPVIIRKKQQP